MFNKVFLICLILSISLSNCVKLDNICNTFKHGGSNGVTVNSIHKVQFNIKLEKISNYLIDENINYNDIFKDNDLIIQKINGIRMSHNKMFREIFNENFLNSPEKIGNQITYYSQIVMNNLNEAITLTIHADRAKWNEFRNNTIKKLKNADRFVFMILLFRGSRIYNNDPNTLESFKNLISNLKKLIKSGQKFVYENETPDYIYDKTNIFSYDKFDSKQLTLITHIYLPFYNSKYVKSDNCLPIEKLPKFYDINYKFNNAN